MNVYAWITEQFVFVPTTVRHIILTYYVNSNRQIILEYLMYCFYFLTPMIVLKNEKISCLKINRLFETAKPMPAVLC